MRLALALIAVLVVAAPARAQAPVTAVPVEGTGTTTAAGRWIAESHPYTATMENTFRPSRIKPGDGFTYDSVMTLNDPEWDTCCDSSDGPSPYSWPFVRVARGDNLWESSTGGATLTGQHTVTYDYDPGRQTTTVHHVVSGETTRNMAPGCYQSFNWNSHLWFPGDDATTGQIATLVVFDEANDVWPTCGPCSPDATGQDDDGDGYPDICDDLECQEFVSGIDSCELLPGDILVERGNMEMRKTQLNAALGGGYWTHAAIVLGYMNLNDPHDANPTTADCDGVQPRFEGDTDPDCELVIAEAMPLDSGAINDWEVRIKDIRETVWGEVREGEDDWNVVRLTGVPAATRRLAAQKLKSHLLYTLDGISAERHAPSQWGTTGIYNVVLEQRGPTMFYCSSLVWWAYQQVGVELDDDRWLFWAWEPVEPAWVTPDEVVSRDETEPAYLRSPSPSGIVMSLYSPAHIMLTDYSGRRTGKDVNGTLYTEIPGAIWRDNGESESVSARNAGSGWNVTVSGFGTGKYTLVRSSPYAYSIVMAPGYTRPGQIDKFSVGSIQMADDYPVPLDDAATAGPRETLIDVLANDYRPAGSQIVPDIVDPPEHGTATVAGDKVRYVPNAGYSGADTFTYSPCLVLDGLACVGLATVALDVTGSSTGNSDGGDDDPDGGATGPSAPPAPPVAPLPPGSGATQPGGGAAPTATLIVARRQRLKKAVRFRVRCSDACDLVAGGRLGRAKVRNVRRSLGAAGEVAIRLKLRGRTHRPGEFRLVVDVRHADGSTQRLRAKLRVTR
jgi:hypothetical protein